MATGATGGFRNWGAATVGLALVALLSACGQTPKGQVLAIVNGEEVTAQQLEAEVVDMPIPPNVDRKMLSKAILQAVIDRELEVQEARRQGIDDTPEFRALLKRNQEDLMVSMLGHKVAQTVPLPAEEDIRNYIQANPLQFARRQRLRVDQLSFAPPKDRRRLAVLANAHSLDQAAATLRSIGVEPVRGKGAIDTGQTDPDLARQLDRAPAGEPILLPQGDRLVVGVITGREPIEVPRDAARVAAARAVRAADLLRESQAQIAASRDKAEIQYEPGYEPETPPARR